MYLGSNQIRFHKKRLYNKQYFEQFKAHTALWSEGLAE